MTKTKISSALFVVAVIISLFASLPVYATQQNNPADAAGSDVGSQQQQADNDFRRQRILEEQKAKQHQPIIIDSATDQEQKAGEDKDKNTESSPAEPLPQEK